MPGHDDPGGIADILGEIVVKKQVDPAGFEQSAVLRIEIMRDKYEREALGALQRRKQPRVSATDRIDRVERRRACAFGSTQKKVGSPVSLDDDLEIGVGQMPDERRTKTGHTLFLSAKALIA